MSDETPAPGNWNARIMAEFRANGGKVGGPFEGAPMLILHTTGAKSGVERETPLMYQDLGNGTVAIFASYAGAPTHPAWYNNLVANPVAEIEVGRRRIRVRARRASGRDGCPQPSARERDAARTAEDSGPYRDVVRCYVARVSGCG